MSGSKYMPSVQVKMSNILLVTLMQVVLTQNLANAGSHVRTNFNPGRQVYFTDPGNRNFGVHSQRMRLRSDSSDQGSHGNLYQHERSNQGPYSDATVPNNNEYNHSEGSDPGNYNGEVHSHNFNRKKEQYRSNDNHASDNVNLESRFDTHDNQQSSDARVRTNANLNDDSRSTNKHVELTTVPVVYLMSATLKTNPNIQNDRGSDTAESIAERQNTDALIFAEIDNRNTDPYDKTSTDNEVRFNKNGTEGEDDGDRWIWGGGTKGTTTPAMITTPKVLTDGGLDDRTSLNGDDCPTGEAKVKGVCVPKH